MKSLLRLATVLGTGVFLARVYARRLRPHVLDWGATPEEASGALPGDDILEDIAVQTTRAITIDAPPEDIWPWLVQMGPRPRAGVYTYDWVERLLGIDIENSDRILPEFQHLEPGEFLGLDENGSNGLAVRQVEENRALVLQWVPATSTWAFVLEPTGDGRTRLLSRNRIPGSGLGFRVGMAFMEPGSLVMERKMLEGIKERVERRALSPLPST
jgi:hypothetical protein